jgi:transposase
VRGRSYAPAGKTPEIRVLNRREGLSVISTVTNRGKVRWKVFEGAINADLLIDFMKRLIKDAKGKKVFLILDNLRVHHAKPVKAWLAEHAQSIEVFYLPSYSPELNPDEMLNADLKSAVTSKAPARAKGDLKKATVSHLRRLQKSPKRVMRYFQHNPVRYAA